MKGVGWLINQKTAGAQSPDLSLGDRIWHKSDFGALSPARICKFRIVPFRRFLQNHCPRAEYLSLNIAPFLLSGAKNPIQPWSPELITCLKQRPARTMRDFRIVNQIMRTL